MCLIYGFAMCLLCVWYRGCYVSDIWVAMCLIYGLLCVWYMGCSVSDIWVALCLIYMGCYVSDIWVAMCLIYGLLCVWYMGCYVVWYIGICCLIYWYMLSDILVAMCLIYVSQKHIPGGYVSHIWFAICSVYGSVLLGMDLEFGTSLLQIHKSVMIFVLMVIIDLFLANIMILYKQWL